MTEVVQPLAPHDQHPKRLKHLVATLARAAGVEAVADMPSRLVADLEEMAMRGGGELPRFLTCAEDAYLELLDLVDRSQRVRASVRSNEWFEMGIKYFETLQRGEGMPRDAQWGGKEGKHRIAWGVLGMMEEREEQKTREYSRTFPCPCSCAEYISQRSLSPSGRH